MTDAAGAEKEVMEVTVADLPMEFRVSATPWQIHSPSPLSTFKIS